MFIRSARRVSFPAVAILTVALSAGPGAGIAQARGATVVSHFVYKGSGDDTSLDSVYLENGAAYLQPDNLLFVTPNWNPHGVAVGVLQTAPIGVRYDDLQATWTVTREDSTSMPLREGFNILVVPATKVGGTAFTATATASNSSGSSLYLDNPRLNAHPRAMLQVTQNLSPGGVLAVRNPHHIGVWYDTSVARWAIFNEDSAPMPTGAAFNVLIGQTVSNGGKAKLLRTTTSNRTGDVVYISDPQTTGNPNNVTFATQVWNPNGAATGSNNNSEIGVFYDTASDREGVFNEDQSAPPVRAGFDLLIFPG